MRLVRIASALAVTAAFAVSGCGDNASYANDDRPPVPVTLTAAIQGEQVRLSPTRVGAGPVVLIIANLTDRSRRVTVESDTLGSDSGGLKQQTSPINPQGTAKLQVDLKEGRYLVHLGDSDKSSTLRVGKPRESSQNQLLLP